MTLTDMSGLTRALDLSSALMAEEKVLLRIHTANYLSRF